MQKMQISDLNTQPPKPQMLPANPPVAQEGLSEPKKPKALNVKAEAKDNGQAEAESKGGKATVASKKPKKKQRIKGNWKKEEDILLMKLVRENGARNWSKIAENFPNRIGKQCRERWHNHLNPKINKKKWTEQEEAILLVTHERFGNRWALISKYLPGRTDNCIKNHWNSTMKRKLRNNFFKNYPLEELKGHLFNGQDDLLEQHSKRGRRKRKAKDCHVGTKRVWAEAMPELSQQTRELDFISSLQSNAQKVPFRPEQLHVAPSRPPADLPLQSLLTLLPSPFLSDSLTNLNNLTTSLQSLLSLLLSKNPMKTPLCPLKLLKQILQFLEINVSSQIQDHFPDQCRFDVKKSFISFLKKDNHFECKKFDQEMKVALDKKIQMMEQEKDRNYQLARLIETIKTKNTSPGQKHTQDGFGPIHAPEQLIRPVSKRLKPHLSNYSIQKSGSIGSQGLSPFTGAKPVAEVRRKSLFKSNMPKTDFFRSSQEDNDDLKNLTIKIRKMQSGKQAQAEAGSELEQSFKHIFVGNFINNFKFQSGQSPLKKVKTEQGFTFKNPPQANPSKRKSSWVKSQCEKADRGTCLPNQSHTRGDKNRTPVYVSLFDSSSIFNKNVVEKEKNCFTSPSNFENKNNSNVQSGSKKNDVLKKELMSRISLNNAELFPANEKAPRALEKRVDTRTRFNAIELNPDAVLDIPRLNQKKQIARNLNFRFKKILEEKNSRMCETPLPKTLDHFADLDSILDEDLLKKNLSGELVDPKERVWKKPFLDLSGIKIAEHKRKSLRRTPLDAKTLASLENPSGIFREITGLQNADRVRDLRQTSKILDFESQSQVARNSKPYPSNVLREKTNLSNKKSKGNFISTFVLKKPFFVDDFSGGKTNEAKETVKENLALRAGQRQNAGNHSLLEEI